MQKIAAIGHVASIGQRQIGGGKLPFAGFQDLSGCSVESAGCYLISPYAVVDANIAPWRAIGGQWRAENDKTENYVYAITL